MYRIRQIVLVKDSEEIEKDKNNFKKKSLTSKKERLFQ